MDLPATLVLIAITVAASLVALRNPPMLEALLLWSPAVRKRGEWWRLFTYGLVHADLTHLLVNMLTFYFFGGLLEDFYAAHLGPFGFYLFYVAALLASILPSYIDHRDDADYRSLGASGAVSAVLFAYILFEPWSLLYVFFAVPIPAIVYAVLYVAYSIHAGKRGGDHINHSAHLWGGAFGVAFTLVLDPSLVNRFLAALLHPGFG
jgi:membrane associated rhomboid family serine protease